MLAVDRDDWSKGREFFGIDGIEIGSLSIDFGRVVLASGPMADSHFLTSRMNDHPNWVDDFHNPQKYYALVAEITSECPKRVSRLPLTDDTECIAILILHCDAFQVSVEIRSYCRYK